MHGCCPKSSRLQALPFTASAGWQCPPAQRCGVLCGGLEVFANKEVLKNTYAYAEIGRANSKAMTALGAPAGSAMGYALGVIYTF